MGVARERAYSLQKESVAMRKGRSAKESGSGLGRTLIKEKRRERRSKKQTDGWLHTSELNDGYNWGRLNLTSVTEESSIDDFLRTAELAGTEFTAEKLNVQVVVPQEYTGLPTVEERKEIEQAQEQNRRFLSIPRRPPWDRTTTTEQLEIKERESFLEWRRSLARLQENEMLTLTPFERNLEFWRQLWRVVERSDVVVQIVDARNPLLFRCEDLERYVDEYHLGKVNMILMSKADLLTSHQRAQWADYFRTTSEIEVAFWSSYVADEKQSAEITEQQLSSESDAREHNSRDECEVGTSQKDDREQGSPISEELLDDVKEEMSSLEALELPQTMETDKEVTESADDSAGRDPLACRSGDTPSFPGASLDVTEGVCSPELLQKSQLLTVEELLALFEKLARGKGLSASPITVGLVGYPNVGKSSTINTLLRQKKVPVSATPGRTKHFQTLYVSPNLLLCDCPGLVFPTFVSTKAELVCSGVLPIDQMRDCLAPTALVCQNIPRRKLEETYGICLPIPGEGEDQDRLPFAHELLSAYACMRGFMTTHGQPDQARAARYILKDYVSGQKLLFCHPPPGTDPVTFNTQLLSSSSSERLHTLGTHRTLQKSHPKPPGKSTLQFDHAYFQKGRGQIHTKTVSAFLAPTEFGKKHWKRNKKEKLRRTVGATPYN